MSRICFFSSVAFDNLTVYFVTPFHCYAACLFSYVVYDLCILANAHPYINDDYCGSIVIAPHYILLSFWMLLSLLFLSLPLSLMVVTAAVVADFAFKYCCTVNACSCSCRHPHHHHHHHDHHDHNLFMLSLFFNCCHYSIVVIIISLLSLILQ